MFIDSHIHLDKFVDDGILDKIIYLVSIAPLLIITLSRKNNIKASFLILRALGRFIGLFNYKPKKYI